MDAVLRFMINSTGQALAQTISSKAAKLLTRDEASRMAANFAKLPELVRRSP